MTNEEINIAIAEACGYEWVSNGWGCRFLGSPTERSFGSDTQSPLCEDAYSSVPNYCNDLNAMHEAEKWMISNLRLLDFWQFAEELKRIVPANLGDDSYIHTTARQRAEAFLTTIGKLEGKK